MKINKYSVIAVLALGSLVASSNLATAQDQKEKGGGRRGPSVEQRMERMTEELKLTDEQKPKVKAVLEDAQKQRQELFTDSSNVPREERREKMRAIMEKENKKLKEILTPDQYAKHEKMMEEMRKGGKGGRKKGQDGQDKKE